MAVLHRAGDSGSVRRVHAAAECTKDGGKLDLATGMLGASLTEARPGKALSDRPAFEPYRGKPAVRHLRGDEGNVGIIRSPVRAFVLPDSVNFGGADWVIAGLGCDNATIMKQAKQVCVFQEAFACAHGHTKWLDCEFIYLYLRRISLGGA
jgi:hypothetical protein